MFPSNSRLLPFSQAAICRAVANHRELRRKELAAVDRVPWISAITRFLLWIMRILIFVFIVLWPWESVE